MKQCRMCGEIKPEEEFPWKSKAKGTRNTACKPCQREYGKQNYKDNTQRYKENSQKNRPQYAERNREYLINYLRENPCIDCGEADILVLEFDHREPLLCRGKRINNYIAGSLERLIEEIEKCDVVCANCHTRRTAKTFGWSRLDYI